MNHKTTFAIAIALVGGIGISVANPWNPKSASMDPIPLVTSQTTKNMRKNSNKDLETTKSSLNMDVAGIKHLKVNIEFGEVEISTNSSTKFSADIAKGISRPVGEKERQWLDNPWLKAKRDADTLTIYEDKSLKPDLINRSSKGREHTQIDFTVNIQIPRGLDADVSLAAGTTTLSGDFQSLKAHVSAGELTLQHFDVSDSLNIEVDAGEVNAKLSRAPARNSNIRVAVGEINLDLKGDATVDAKFGIGSIDVAGEGKDDQKGLGAKQQIKIGAGGTKFVLDVDAGSINLGESKKTNRTRDNLDLDKDFDMKFDAHSIKGDQIQEEVSKALKGAHLEIEKALNDKGIQAEIANALKDARVEIDRAMNDKDIQAEIAKALQEAHIEVGRAMKSSDREIAQAMKELEEEMKEDSDAKGPYSKIVRDALDIARQSLKESMASVKRALETAKLSQKRAGAKRKAHINE